MKKIRMNLGEDSYFIYAGYPIEKLGSRMDKRNYGKKVMLLTDSNVFPRYGRAIEKAVTGTGREVIDFLVKPGEEVKSLRKIYEIMEACAKNRMGRDDTLLTLGGGVASDLGGFAASIYMRGINFIAVPTTLLAQVDASIGGKTGVNLPFGKNLVGSFYQPSFVYMDFKTLQTLPEIELKQGLAEIIKYGVIKSRKIFGILGSVSFTGIRKYLPRLIEESILIKRDVVEKDEKEKKGLREILNFGHTLGHAIEIAHFPKLSHGESVALGMVGEGYFSWRLGICRREVYSDIREIVKKCRLPFSFQTVKTERLPDFLQYDKKARRGNIRFVMVRDIGTVKTGVVIKPEEVTRLLKEMGQNEKP